MFNPEIIKKDFPILQQQINDQPLVYLDSGATTQKPHCVIESLTEYYTGYNANIHRGIYTLSEKATAAYENARKKVQQFINATADQEIIFTSGTTESINLVALSWAKQYLNQGDVVVLTDMEHHSNFVPWFRLEAELGITRKFIGIDEEGFLKLADYKKILKEGKVKLVCLPHVSNVLGTINPVKEIVELAHEHGALVLVDGAQAVPHLEVDVQDLGVDFYAFSGHKMLAPTGTGVLYGKQNILNEMQPFKSGGDMILSVHKNSVTFNDLPWRFEAGTPHVAGVIGLGTAIDYLSKIGLDTIHKHEQKLIQHAYRRLTEEFDGIIQLFGPDPLTYPEQRSGVLSFHLQSIHPHDVASILNDDNICVRAGHHCAQPLMDVLQMTALTRATFYLYNTEDDVEALVDGLKKVVNIFA